MRIRRRLRHEPLRNGKSRPATGQLLPQGE